MPMYRWSFTNEITYNEWHVVVSAPDVDKARTIAFDLFCDAHGGEQAAFHLNYNPDQVIDGDGAIVIASETSVAIG